MAQTFNNNNEMKNYFNKVIEEAIEAVSNDLLKDFQEHIKNTIYSAKPGEYVRYGGANGLGEGGFGSGWKISDEQNKQIGDYARLRMKERFLNNEIKPKNAPMTIAYKGSNTPLYATGKMASSIKSEVH